MKLKKPCALLDIVTDVNGQYSKEERMRAAMRLRSCYACFFQKNDYICSMLTFVAILGFVMLIGAALNEVRHSKTI